MRFYFGSLSDPIAHFRSLQVLVSLEQLNKTSGRFFRIYANFCMDVPVMANFSFIVFLVAWYAFCVIQLNYRNSFLDRSWSQILRFEHRYSLKWHYSYLKSLDFRTKTVSCSFLLSVKVLSRLFVYVKICREKQVCDTNEWLEEITSIIRLKCYIFFSLRYGN